MDSALTTELDEKYERILEYSISLMQQHLNERIAEAKDPELSVYQYYQNLKLEYTRENIIKNYKNALKTKRTPMECAELVLLTAHAQAELIYMLQTKKSTRKQYGRTTIGPIFDLSVEKLISFNL